MDPDVLDDDVHSGRTVRCPACRASVRAETPWCTQCFRDLRPAPPGHGPAAGQSIPSPAGQRVAESWPCTSCAAVNPMALDACHACGLGFLSDLRSGAAPLLVLPGVGDLASLGRAQRMLLAAGVVLAVMLLTALTGLLLL